MIFFLYGQDTYRSREKLKELKEKFVREVDPSGANCVVLQGDAMKPEDFRNAVSAMSMFVKKRMVVVERLLESGKKDMQKAVAEYIVSKDFPDDHIVVFWEGEVGKSKVSAKGGSASGGKSSKAKKAGKKKESPSTSSGTIVLLDVLKKQKYVQEFALLAPIEVEQWIGEEVKKCGGRITAGAVRLLAGAVGDDLWRLSNEIGKLLAGDVSITEDAVREGVLSKTESAIFAFTDALANRRGDEALQLLTNERNAGVESLHLLAMMIRQFRILLRLSQHDTEGLHPFVVQKAQQQLHRFSLDELKNIYRQLLEIDVSLKTTRTDPDTLLTLFVREIAVPSETSPARRYSS